MEATGLTLRSGAVGNQPCRRRFQAATLLGPLAWSLAVVLALCGGWLLLRRLTGAFTKPLPDVVLLSAGMCAVVCAAAARLLWRRAAGENSVSAWRVRDWLPTVALVFVATSAAVPGSSVTVIVLLWVMIAAEEVAAAWLGRMRRGAGRHRSIALYHRSGERPEILPPQSDSRATQRGVMGSDVWQHYTRQRVSDGQEFVHGTFCASFVAGQRTAIEHLVFCPMLAAVPQITAVALDESDCTVRATHIYRYGARLEIRLSEPCEEPGDVLVRYEARG